MTHKEQTTFTSGVGSFRSRGRRWFYPAAVTCLVIFGLYIRREALSSDFFADDYAQLGMLEGFYPLSRAPWDLFKFSDGSLTEGRALMRVGFYPWWSDPQVRMAMWRPLASLMIAMDHHWFGNRPLGYHIHSAFWWVLMLGAIAMLYRRLLPLPYALVAFALLVCDEAHGVPLAWLCNRAVLVSVPLSIVTASAYVRFRRDRSIGWLLAAIASCCLAFGFGEYTACAFGYVIAYEVSYGTGGVRERLGAFLPMLAPAILYLCLRGWLGDTMRHSGVYVDPLTEPLAFVQAIFLRMPVLIGDLLLGLRSDFWTFGSAFVYEWFERGWVEERWIYDMQPWRWLQWSVGIAACVALAVIVKLSLREERHRSVRVLLLGSVLSLVPVCGSFPSSRLVLMALVGFAPALAAWIVDGCSALRTGIHSRNLKTITLAGLCASVAAYHIIVPVRVERGETITMHDVMVRVREAILALPVDDAKLVQQDLILLSAPEGGTSMYLPMTRQLHHRTAPRTCLPLSFARAPYKLVREAQDAFTMRFAGSRTLLESSTEQLLRSPALPFRVGDLVTAGPLRVTVLELFRGRPQYLRVQLDRSLDDSSLLFMVPAEEGYVRFQMPKVGESRVVPVPVTPEVPAAVPQLAGRS